MIHQDKLNMTDSVTRESRDRRALELLEKVMEIEQRMIPTGLHVFGRASTFEEISDLLRMVASFDRAEMGIRSLPDLVAEGLGFADYDDLIKQSSASTERMSERERVEMIVKRAIEIFVEGGDSASKSSSAFLESEASVPIEQSQKILSLLESVRSQLRTNREMDGLVQALKGQYVEPGPGADIIQNPGILPTGRNTHAINPYVVPSPAAMRRAEQVAKALVERHAKETGRCPETIAMVLWGIDNIKTEGEAVAQVLWLLGATPRRDSLNRVTDVDVTPLSELGRPRIDIVMTVSGIFRDLFGSTMSLLDLAVRRVAALDEPLESNYVRKHIEEQRRETGCGFDEAVVRVFSNAAGNYGANVNFMVLDSQWEQSGELGDLFIARKCFAYGRDSEGRSFDGRESRNLLERALARVEVTYQNIDTTEVGITDVDHYFEYLGGVSNAVERRNGARPRIYLSDTLSPGAKVRTLEETIKLETRTKTLNPKWFEGMLRHGFSGVAEIEHHVTNTFGWSATADAVDDWIYDEVAQTFVLDEYMLDRLRTLNPHSARALVGRLLEASGRGLWSASDDALDRLRSAFLGLEDELEGAI
jgi:magnesium chelatase subunit H